MAREQLSDAAHVRPECRVVVNAPESFDNLRIFFAADADLVGRCHKTGQSKPSPGGIDRASARASNETPAASAVIKNTGNRLFASSCHTLCGGSWLINCRAVLRAQKAGIIG
jgi:hypothetical protein